MSTSTQPTREMTPAYLQQAYQRLIDALPKTGAQAIEWEDLFWRWNDLKCWISGEFSRRHFKEMQDSRDKAAEDAMRFMREQILPLAETSDATLREAFLQSPVRGALESALSQHLFTKLELDQEAFVPDNVALQTQEGEISSQYERVRGGAEVTINGETLTLTRAQAKLTDPDRAVRQAAWEATNAWELDHRAQMHGIYDELVTLRQQMAVNKGEANFVPLGYRRMGRTDYGPAEVRAFRDGIRQHVTPLLKRFREAQARDLGTETVRPWDAAYYPNLSLGPNVVPVENQLAQAQNLFDRLHPTLAGHFKAMVDGGLIDLENRPGKCAGAFATAFEDEGKVVIFCNSTGTDGDVTTLTHEMGHAFQGWESRPIRSVDLRWPTSDACEIHSMGMEFLALKEITAFFSPEDAKRFRRLKLIRTLTLLPYIAVVDAFQHWVYEHPGHSHAEREAAWVEAWDTYNPGIDYAGLEDAKATRWMRQPHIFVMPFYYIDYAIAEVGALQLWRMAEEDHDKAMTAYLELCRIGGTRSVLGVFQAGGLKSPFEPDVFKPLMEAVAAELGV
ncbi:Peptidase family M3 [compost metagenome]